MLRFFYKCQYTLNPKRLYREVKWFIQRGRRGYSDSDVWDLGCYVSGVMSQALRDLADTHHGCPPDLFDAGRKGDECWKWNKILREMADGFTAIGEVNYADWSEDLSRELKEIDRGMDLFAKYVLNLWD